MLTALHLKVSDVTVTVVISLPINGNRLGSDFRRGCCRSLAIIFPRAAELERGRDFYHVGLTPLVGSFGGRQLSSSIVRVRGFRSRQIETKYTKPNLAPDLQGTKPAVQYLISLRITDSQPQSCRHPSPPGWPPAATSTLCE